MARIVVGDAVSFRTIIDRHAEPARRIDYRMLGDPSDAEDVAQEAMLRLWQRAGLWKPTPAGVGGWVRRVTMNLCLDRLRRRRFVSGEAVPDRADNAPLPDHVMESAHTRARVRRCLDALGENQRGAIVLTYYEDLSNIMAADAMGLNIKAFESLLLRARQSLRRALVAEGVVDLETGSAA